MIDSFEYHEYEGTNDWNSDQFKDPVTVEHCRIDRRSEYTSTTSGKQLLFNSLIFCYKDITDPLPEFKKQSKVIIDGQEHRITKIIKNHEPYKKEVYSYELEVI